MPDSRNSRCFCPFGLVGISTAQLPQPARTKALRESARRTRQLAEKPLPPLWGKVGMGGDAAQERFKIDRLGEHQSCGVTPHPAPPKLTSFPEASHPSPTRGEG